MTIDFATHLERGLEGRMPRGNFPAYMRTIDRQLKNESNERNSRWGISDTYDHTREIPQSDKNGGKSGRNDPRRTFPRNKPLSQKRVNCTVGGKVGDVEDNEGYFDEDWYNSDYQQCRPLGQVNFTGGDNNYSSCEIEFGDVEGRNKDSEVGGYLSNHSVANEYRDSERSGGCDVFKTSALKNFARK